MEKKVTVRDVAREAGVSVATVSYIMNNRTDQKISEATRKKVLQIANLLNYTPSSVAKSLATGRNSIIGISYHMNPSTPARNLELGYFTDLLAERLNRLKYDVLFLPVQDKSQPITINRNIDGIIALDLSKDDFLTLSDNCFVPIISVDMLINDNLFYQIYSDIPKCIAQARDFLGEDFYLVTDSRENEAYFSYITQGLAPEKILRFDDFTIEELGSKIKGRKVLVLGSFLALILRPYVEDSNMAVISSNETENILPKSIHLIRNDISKKANLAINILLNALDRKFDVKHDHKV